MNTSQQFLENFKTEVAALFNPIEVQLNGVGGDNWAFIKVQGLDFSVSEDDECQRKYIIFVDRLNTSIQGTGPTLREAAVNYMRQINALPKINL